MEQWLPVILGVVGFVIVLKALKGAVKLIALGLIVALVVALYMGAGR
jgi:hypothetical protein